MRIFNCVIKKRLKVQCSSYPPPPRSPPSFRVWVLYLSILKILVYLDDVGLDTGQINGISAVSLPASCRTSRYISAVSLPASCRTSRYISAVSLPASCRTSRYISGFRFLKNREGGPYFNFRFWIPHNSYEILNSVMVMDQTSAE